MNYLLDTNTVSEWVKRDPNPGVVEWLDSVDEDRTYLSVVTIGELRRGVERLPGGRRKSRLDEWLTHELPDRFQARLLSFDAAVAEVWGRLRARTDARGRSIDPVDAQLAATAGAHGLVVVTRNESDFDRTGVPSVNPWRARL